MTAFQVGRALAARGHSIHMMAMEDGPLGDEARQFAAVHVHGVFTHTAFTPDNFRHPKELLDWLSAYVPAVRSGRQSESDHIYVNFYSALPWALATSARRRTPILCHIHAHAGDLGRQGRWWATRVQSFVAPSESVRRSLVRGGVPEDRIHVVPNGIDPREYRPSTPSSRAATREALGLPPEGRVALYYGRLTKEKGLEVLVDAWRRLGMPRGEAALLIVGPGRMLYQGGGDDDRLDVRVLPGQEDVVPLLHAADLVVVPSLQPEGFGRVVIEAMATGCPVVASDCGAIPEILVGRFASGLFETGRAGDLTRALRDHIDWRDRDPGLGDACVAHATSHYALDDVVSRLEGILASA